MLTKGSLNAAYALADKLARRGIALQPIAETPLAQLIHTSLVHVKTDMAANPSGEVPYDASNALLEGSVFKDASGAVPHDEAMAAAVAAVSKAVSFTIDLSRNRVNPIVKRVAAAADTALVTGQQASLMPMTIEPFYYLPIWDSPILIDLVDRHANVNPGETRLKCLSIARPASYVDAMATNVRSFDEEILGFFNAVGENFVAGVWQSLFNPTTGTNLMDALRGNFEQANAAIVIYLLARNAQETIPEGVDMELSTWRAYISGIMAQAGRAVVRCLQKRRQDVTMKTLIISAPDSETANGPVVVVGDVYDAWVREGGTPELIFGAIYTGARRGYADLLQNAEALRKAWQRNHNLLESQLSFQKFGLLVAGLRTAVTAEINALSDEELVVDRAILHQRLKTLLTFVKQSDLESVWKVARKLVCRSMFAHTDAETYLVAVDNSAAAHPELELREAALLATVDYVTGWACKLFTVEDVPDVAPRYITTADLKSAAQA